MWTWWGKEEQDTTESKKQLKLLYHEAEYSGSLFSWHMWNKRKEQWLCFQDTELREASKPTSSWRGQDWKCPGNSCHLLLLIPRPHPHLSVSCQGKWYFLRWQKRQVAKKKKKKSGFLWFLSPPYLGFCFDKEKSSSDPIFVKDRRDGTGSRSLSCCWFHCPLRMDKEEDTRDSVMGDHGPIETILVSKKEG